MNGKIARRAGMALICMGVLGAATLSAAPAEARVHVGVVVPIGPPALRVEPVPPPPARYRADRVAWQPGHWRWDGRAYDWVPGHYVEIPRHRRHWEAGRWEERPGGWAFVEGRWR